MALMRHIATVGGYTMASRVLGFARDILIAAMLGAGPVADAFFVAFKLPNFFRRLFAEGAFNAAFVPLFSGLIAEGGLARAQRFAESVLALMAVALLLFVALMQFVMPFAMYVFAPGFAADPDRFDLAVQFTRITFPYLLFISLVSALGGVLNGLDRFAAAAATPILLNLVLIAALFGLAPHLPTPGHALSWGVAAAGAAQFLWLIAACRRAGMALRLPRPRLNPKVRRLLTLMVPGAIGAGVVQINLVIDLIIASLLPAGSVSYLYYADRINQLPLGVIGVAAGTALLPLLSRQIRMGEDGAAMQSFNRAMEFSLLLAIPAAAALMVIAGPVVSVLFERGAFDNATATASAGALTAYAVGLPAYVLIKILGPGFFARQDTVTPVKIAALCVVINLGLNLVLMEPFAHVGIALATALSAWINSALLWVVLARRGHVRLDARLRRRLPRVILASAIMAAALAGVAILLGPLLLGGSAALKIAALAIMVVGGLVLYGGLVQLTGAATLRELRQGLRRGAA